MTIPRGQQIDTDQTPYYHCVSRCVRRAFLCGEDRYTGKSFEHRRAWIEARLRALAGIFAIDLCAYAVMSNHFHVVLHINTDRQAAMEDGEVVERWSRLHRLPDAFDQLREADRQARIAVWRERLGCISWFMKSVNEPLARLANREDGCKGRFWEGRFRSQAILDEAALLKCMAYVDLNPIRAGIAKTPESSMHTSVKARIDGDTDGLAPLDDERSYGFRLPIKRLEYLSLVDWIGRRLRHGKRGRIEASLAPIIERLQASGSWIEDMRHLSRRYYRAIGSIAALTRYRAHLGQQRLKGLSA